MVLFCHYSTMEKNKKDTEIAAQFTQKDTKLNVTKGKNRGKKQGRP